MTAANEIDAQAAYESQMSLWGSMMGGAHLINHAAGWMHGGLTASFEKLILDAEMLQMMAAYFDPLEVDEASLAIEAIREVGPSGHFFGAAHTMERYRDAFYAPLISDWTSHETWREAGASTARDRAAEVWRSLLVTYEQPALDPGIAEALDAYVIRRTEEGGAPMN